MIPKLDMLVTVNPKIPRIEHEVQDRLVSLSPLRIPELEAKPRAA